MNYGPNSLPLWSSNFEDMRKNNAIYVDKTDLIYTIASQRGFFFLNRPRRFGKSLLISTFKSLFSDGVKNFSGLKIENKWNDKKYKVLKLDFSYAKDARSIEDFIDMCWDMFSNGCKIGKIPFYSKEGDRPGKMLNAIINTLEEEQYLVLLIDEYDSPLNATLNNPMLFEKIRTDLSNFYSVIKSNTDSFRFVFLTGIAKFNQACIFSSLNNLIDISLKKEYGELLGYTEEELVHYFGDYISKASEIRNITQEEMLEKLREQYDGFCFDKTASTHVYAPWSVLNFFKNLDEDLENYWYNSSGRPTVLLKYLKSRKTFDFNSYNYFSKFNISISDLEVARDIDTLRDDILLIQTGYLTIKAVDEKDAIIGYPNKEVSSSMAQLAIECMTDENATNSGINNLKKHLKQNNPKDIVQIFSNAFLNIPYYRYPVCDEAACRALILMLLQGAQVFSFAERPNALGRSDLEVVVEKNHWVFEFKFIANGKPSEEAPQNSVPPWARKKPQDKKELRPVVQGEISLLADALEQMRRSRYGEGFLPGKNLIRVAMVFSQKDKSFVEWETYPLSRRADASARKGWAQRLASELRNRGWTEDMLLALQEESEQSPEEEGQGPTACAELSPPKAHAGRGRKTFRPRRKGRHA